MPAQYFFSSINDIPADAGISAWGPVHVGWLIFWAIAWVAGCCVFRKQSPQVRAKWLRILALIIVGQEIIKDLLFWYSGDLEFDHLPLHLCGIAIFICALYAFKKTPLAGQMLYAAVIPGALAALIFLDWTQYPALHFSGIHSFLIHGNLVLFGLMPIAAGDIRPNPRMLPKVLGVLAIMAAALYPFNKWLGTNFFFLNTPSPGSPLVPLETLLGNPGYIGGLVALLILVWVLIYTPWVLAARRQRSTQPTDSAV